MLHATRLGRDIYAVGGNREAARLAGIPTGKIIVLAYALSGLCAGIAALLLIARLTTSTEALGNGMELTAIAAAVIGGVSLQGGIGSVCGPTIGAFLLGVVLIGLTLLGVSQFVQQILTGAILLAAICYDRFLSSAPKQTGAQILLEHNDMSERPLLAGHGLSKIYGKPQSSRQCRIQCEGRRSSRPRWIKRRGQINTHQDT